MSEARKFARELAREHVARGSVTGWFEPLYLAAGGDAAKVAWGDLFPHPGLVEWMARGVVRRGRALVVGCGLGDDAEEVARAGLDVVAFDIAPTAVEWAARRFPGTRVRYEVADVFAPPPSWTRAFGLVVEANTLQSFPPGTRAPAVESIASFVAPGGVLLVLARGRDEKEEAASFPWALAPSEIERFELTGLELVRFDDTMDRESPPVRRFRAEYRRPRTSAS